MEDRSKIRAQLQYAASIEMVRGKKLHVETLYIQAVELLGDPATRKDGRELSDYLYTTILDLTPSRMGLEMADAIEV